MMLIGLIENLNWLGCEIMSKYEQKIEKAMREIEEYYRELQEKAVN